MKIKVLGLAVASVMAFSAQASDVAYSYAELNYTLGEISDFDTDFNTDVDVNGLGFGGSFDFGNNLFVFGGLDLLEFDVTVPGFGSDSVDVDFTQIGLGYHYPISAAVDLVPTISYVSIDAVGSESGYGLGLGLRGMATPNLEWLANVERLDISELEETGYELGGVYYFDNGFGVGASYESKADIDGFSLKLRYKF